MQNKMVLHIQKIKVICYGWYGKDNCGDESYKISLRQLFPDFDIDFVNKIDIKNIANYKIIILGGGNILEKPFLKELDEIKGIDIYAFSVGVSEKLELKDILKFKKIYVRDINSYNYIKLLGYNDCFLSSDAAFCLVPNKDRGKRLIKDLFKERDLYSNIISIVINSHLLGSSGELSRDFLNFQKFSLDMANIIDSTNASFIFLPFSTGEPRDDRVSNGWVASKCKFWKKNKVVYEELCFMDILDIISAVDLSINTRLHSSIFSCLSETPFIDITHHDKNLSFLRTIDREDLSIDYWHFNYEKIKDLINKNIYNNDIDFNSINAKMKDRLKWCSDDLYISAK